MAFIPLKQKSSILKVSDLYGKWLIGKYIKRTKSDYSFVYWFHDESGKEIKLYGNKSLDPYMDESLLEQTLAITCVELKDTGKGYPFAIAAVAIWDPSATDSSPASNIVDPNMPKPMSID